MAVLIRIVAALILGVAGAIVGAAIAFTFNLQPLWWTPVACFLCAFSFSMLRPED